MRLSFRKSFERDLRRISDPVVPKRVRRSIEQVEAAEHLSRVRGARRLSGSGSLYRIRIGEYRIGLAVEASDVEIRAGSAPPRHLSVFSVKLVQGAGLVQRERVGFLEGVGVAVALPEPRPSLPRLASDARFEQQHAGVVACRLASTQLAVPPPTVV